MKCGVPSQGDLNVRNPLPSLRRPAYAGTDFIIARDGKIAAVYLFFDELPDMQAPTVRGATHEE